MKIAIDARFYRKSTGGIGRYTRALLRELAKSDIKNHYTVYLSKEDAKEYDIQVKNFQTKIVDVTHYSLREQTKFLGELNKHKYDLVHFTNFNHPLLYKGKFIITIHDLTLMLYPSNKKKHSLIKKIGLSLTMKNATKHAKKIIAVSQATKNDLVNVLGADPRKIEVVYEGIDDSYQSSVTSRQTGTRKKLPTENCQLKTLQKYQIAKPYLLFVSQWRPHKGILQLVKAFEILKKDYKIPHKLAIVGKPNSDFPEIPYAIRHTPYANEIITPGFVAEEDLPEIYRQADVFVFPSHYEGFGLGPLEAMACGTPVASSNTSCMPEILGKAAVYFDPYNPKNMADAINELIANKQLRQEKISQGLKQVKKYSWSKMAQQTLQIYHDVLD